ncbi:uncharacterized protein LOC124496321 [Dermatophagoides farinae]|uniref:uncharacterized protein LOC124496321 n=1 Tax=Dermatophagoides farinae TaxID=6954 RepID=UPI001F0E4543|nr:mRNA export factor GLE1-like [Dermatophagoides farinae]
MGCGVSSDHSNITNSTSSTSSMINNHSNNNINGIHHHHHQPNYHHRHNNFRKQPTQQSSLSSPVSSSATAVRSNLISNANRTSSGGVGVGVGGSIDGDGNNGDRFILNSSDDSTTNGSGDCIANGVPIVDKRNVLQLFNNLESTIQTMEETKCFEKYRIASDDGEQVKELIQNLNEKNDEMNNNNNNLLNTNETKLTNEHTFGDMIVDNLSSHNLSPKETFLIESFNKQKINELKIELLEKDLDNYESELKELQILCDQLHELYQQRDNVLNQIFEGNYGSEKEIQLEKELDSLIEERHYIEIAKIRWINSDNLIIDALKCLDIGVEKIRQFHQVPENDYVFRYTCMKEARNSLVLAHYNLISLHNNLKNVQLPHCKIEDIDHLEKELIKLFNDLTADRLESMINSLELLRTKMVTQHKWVKEVLNKTIKSDLLNIRDKCRNKAHELRFERAMLIKQKQEQWNHEENGGSSMIADTIIKNESPFDLRVDSGVDSELDESVIVDDQYNRILTSAKDSILSTDFSNSTPLLPGEELGPMPSNKEIFGKITQIHQKHLREMQEFEQNQLMNKARMSQGLKEKLDVRRCRRNRIEMHKRQLEALQE